MTNLQKQKIFILKESFIKLLFTWKDYSNIQLPEFDLPKDSIITNIEYSHIGKAFEVYIHSETFESIPKGDPFPTETLKYKFIKIPTS